MLKNTLLFLGFFILLFLLEGSIKGVAIEKASKNILDARSLQILAEQDKLYIDVFADKNSLVGKSIANFLEPVLAHLPDVKANYIDPKVYPNLLRENGISMKGEILIRNDRKQLHLTELSYEPLINLMQKLNQDDEKWVIFLEGYGARNVSSQSSDGLSHLLTDMRKAGFPVARMAFDKEVNVPDNVKLLIIPAPKESIGQDLLMWLEQGIAQGISVWWLTEPELASKQPNLSLLFDVIPLAQSEDEDLIIHQFPEHKINKDFGRPVHLAQALRFDSLTTALWVDKKGLRVAAVQEIGKARLLVSGDADFISNQFLNVAANKSMAFRLIDWLLLNDKHVNLPPMSASQSQINLDASEVLVFSGLMIILIPLLLLMMAFVMWRKMKKNS